MAMSAVPDCARPRLASWREATEAQPLVTIADLPVYQGDGATYIVEVWAADGTPYDLTGYSAASHIRNGPADQFPIITEWVCTIEASTVRMYLPKDRAKLLRYDQGYVYDLELQASDGTPTTIVAGTVPVVPEITRIEVVP